MTAHGAFGSAKGTLLLSKDINVLLMGQAACNFQVVGLKMTVWSQTGVGVVKGIS